MAFRIGRCTNDLYCSFASSEQDIQVPMDANFVCSQCGKGLSQPAAKNGGVARMAMMAGGAVALAGGGLLVAGFMMNGHAASAPMAAPMAVASAPIAAAAAPAPALVPAPAPAVAAQTTVAATVTQLAQTVATPATATPSPAVTIAALAAPAPAHTDAAPMQMAMLEQVHPQANPAAAPKQTLAAETAVQTRAAAEKVRKAELADAKAKKLAALAEEKAADEKLADAKRAEAATRAAQLAAAAAPAAPAKPVVSLAVTTAAPRMAAAAAVPRVVARPAAPQLVSESFSSRPIAGGAPAFPSDDDYVGKAGAVTVNCRIQVDGRPAGCNVVAARGGPAFKASVLRWLNSGRVRYAPIVRNGQPVSESHQWSVQFQGDNP